MRRYGRAAGRDRSNGPEPAESVQHGFRGGQGPNRIRLETGTGSEASFKLAVKDKSREGEFFFVSAQRKS
jgi:hypothetical protein